ncbi:unnamed protein product [Linum trigynum]|uniref:Transmembrane protein n=1 Tax=Linum trigynum TaxID=586398 RepID=A0AAV2G7D1_9ROSI
MCYSRGNFTVPPLIFLVVNIDVPLRSIVSISSLDFALILSLVLVGDRIHFLFFLVIFVLFFFAFFCILSLFSSVVPSIKVNSEEIDLQLRSVAAVVRRQGRKKIIGASSSSSSS